MTEIFSRREEGRYLLLFLDSAWEVEYVVVAEIQAWPKQERMPSSGEGDTLLAAHSVQRPHV